LGRRARRSGSFKDLPIGFKTLCEHPVSLGSSDLQFSHRRWLLLGFVE
jgi:hypothetical protein